MTGRRAQFGAGHSFAPQILAHCLLRAQRCSGEQSTQKTGHGTRSMAGVPVRVTKDTGGTGLTQGHSQEAAVTIRTTDGAGCGGGDSGQRLDLFGRWS